MKTIPIITIFTALGVLASSTWAAPPVEPVAAQHSRAARAQSAEHVQFLFTQASKEDGARAERLLLRADLIEAAAQARETASPVEQIDRLVRFIALNQDLLEEASAPLPPVK